MKYFLYILKRKINRIERRLNFPIFIFINPYRIICVSLERILFKSLYNSSKNFLFIGNYYLDVEKLKKKEINILSAGIGVSFEFEQSLVKEFNVKKLICIDPTDQSEQLIKKSNIECQFVKGALYNKNSEVKIFKPQLDEDTNYSISNLNNSNNFEYIKSFTAFDLIKKYNLLNLDILKLDVEGVAVEILEDLIENKKFYPKQICLEIERPVFFNQLKFFKSLLKFNKILKSKYEIFWYTNKKLGQRTELLCILK